MAQPASEGKILHQDLVNRVKPIQSLKAQVVTTTQNGAGVDLKGYESAVVIVDVGVFTDDLDANNKVTLAIEESSDNGSSDAFAAVDASCLFGGTGLSVIDNITDHSGIIQWTGVKNVERYIRVTATVTGTLTAGVPLSAVVVKGNPRVAPATM